MHWVVLSLISASLAGATAVVAKAGLEKVDSSVGFAIQTVVMLFLTWGVIGVQGNVSALKDIAPKDWGLLLLTGAISTAAFLFYFAAVKAGAASQATPIDRLSLVFTVILAALFLKEKLCPQIIIGCLLMAGGALLIATVKPAQP